ncbi:hypothetical protein [Promicromonospora sukumoe]
MSDEWHPGMRRELLPGPCEAVLSSRSLGWTVSGIAAAVVVLALLLVDPSLWVWGLGPSAVSVAGIAVGGMLDSAAVSQQRREAQAGYTTVAADRTDLDHVDHRTSRVVRRAGEELTAHELHVRLRRVRAAR